MKKEIKIFLQKILLKLFNLECPRHIVGEVTYDIKGDAYSKCRICDEELTLVGKTLGEIDVMTLEMVSKLLPKNLTLEDFAISANKQ